MQTLDAGRLEGTGEESKKGKVLEENGKKADEEGRRVKMQEG